MTAAIRKKLQRRGEALVLTHSEAGASFSLLSGAKVAGSTARAIQDDLFVRPQEDGLFPGHSQTWKADE